MWAERIGKEGAMMQKPEPIDPLADLILQRLRQYPASSEIVLGGYFALSHHINYRRTHDIDAWWKQRASPEAEEAIRQVMQGVAKEMNYKFLEQRNGEVIFFDLMEPDGKRFSFQIAVRSRALAKAEASPWPPIEIELLQDNIAAKMNALVHRGTPRDFTDLQMIVKCGLATIGECWRLWASANPDRDVIDAKKQSLFHLTSLELRRPLEAIPEAQERRRAQTTRHWFHNDFLAHDRLPSPDRERDREPDREP
jgi:hypothetical protein